MDWRRAFVGREADMEILRGAYEDARGGKTRVVALVAESGFGKTRLAQEFYGWLSTAHDGVGGAGYWPDELLRRENNLQVNPDITGCGGDGKRMPFLWWGLRISDPGGRNQGLDDALRHGVAVLKAHLEAYAREIALERLKRGRLLGGGKGALDVAVSLGETAVEKFLDASTFGLLGVGKTVVEAGLAQRELGREISRLESQDASPGSAERQRRDMLTETILDDLYRVAKTPPEGFAPVPLVILIDDAQWLAADPGMAAFLPELIKRARSEAWPLLLVLTSWRAEWRRSAAEGVAPGVLAGEGDIVHELGRAEGVETLIAAAFPGLPDTQCEALAAKADGNPRLLDEMLMFLERRRKLFVDRDQAGALTPQGLDEMLTRDFAEFVADRFEEAPDHVRRALAIASLQGVAFSPRLVRRVAEGLKLVNTDRGLAEGDDPHSFVIVGEDGEFRIAPYRDAARGDLANHLDETDAEAALVRGLRETAAAVGDADERELVLAFGFLEVLADDEEERDLAALTVAAELIKRAEARFDARAAGAIADKAMPLLATALRKVTKDDFSGVVETLYSVLDADMTWRGSFREHAAAYQQIVDALRTLAEAQPMPGAQRAFAVALGRLGGVVEALDGPAAARPLGEEETALCRALAEAQPTPGARRELAIALGRLGGIIEALDGPAAARSLREEATAIKRALAEAQPTPGARRELAIALAHLGGVVEALDGYAAARPLREEETELLRALAEAQPTPGARQELANALARLGGVIEALDGPAAARTLRAEETALCRALAEAQPTPRARRNLANALGRLGGVVEALDGPAAARPLREKETAIKRALAEAQPMPGVRREFANALARLGGVIEALDGPAAARSLREEATAIKRALAEAQPTPGARRELAIALVELGGVVEALDGPAAARPLREEYTAIFRALAEAQPTPGARRELAIALANLGDVVEALDGPAAARPLCEEYTAIFRALAEAQPTSGARRELSIALAQLGGVIEALDGPAAARPLREEATAIKRAVAEAQPTLGARRELAIALDSLGDIVEALDGPAAARPLREEETAMRRALAEAQPTPGARRELAIALANLGGVVEALDGPAAARSLREEATAIKRALAEAQPTPGARRELAIALANLGGVVEALDGPAAARPLREEETTILRALAEAQPTPGARRELAIALANLGGVVEALSGPAAARPLREEETEISRALAEAQPTPGARRELAIALANLGGVVEALDGPAAARPLREEETEISRALAEVQPTPGTRRELAIALGSLGSVIEALDGPAAARPLREEETTILRALAEAQPTPQSMLDLAAALDKFSDTVLLIEGPETVFESRREAVELAKRAHDALSGSSSLIWLLGLRLRVLTDALLGSAPWQRAFALEAAGGATPQLAGELAQLRDEFCNWEAEFAFSGSGWPEEAAIDLARCHLAIGEATAAHKIASAASPVLDGLAAEQPTRFGPVAAAMAIDEGRATAQLGKMTEADAAFARSARLNDQIVSSSPLARRRAAAIAWFTAAHLQQTGRPAEARATLEAGLVPAKAFAELGIMDGAAIVGAFEKELGGVQETKSGSD